MATMGGAIYTDLDEHGQRGLLIISRGTAILLLGVYVAYLIFQLKTHAALFHPKPGEGEALPDESGLVVEEEEEVARMSVVAAGVR
jgi:Ca2+:H+ antiporter